MVSAVHFGQCAEWHQGAHPHGPYTRLSRDAYPYAFAYAYGTQYHIELPPPFWRGADVFFCMRLAGLPSLIYDLRGPFRRSHGMEGLISYGEPCT